MGLYIEVQTLAGSGIDATIRDMIIKSQQLQMGICTNFNGAHILVWPYSKFEAVHKEWKADMAQQAQAFRDKQ